MPEIGCFYITVNQNLYIWKNGGATQSFLLGESKNKDRFANTNVQTPP